MNQSKQQVFRLNTGGRIDRSRTLSFTFNGQRYQGHPGDTLASALLANGVDIVNRSFKYSRPPRHRRRGRRRAQCHRATG